MVVDWCMHKVVDHRSVCGNRNGLGNRDCGRRHLQIAVFKSVLLVQIFVLVHILVLDDGVQDRETVNVAEGDTLIILLYLLTELFNIADGIVLCFFGVCEVVRIFDFLLGFLDLFFLGATSWRSLGIRWRSLFFKLRRILDALLYTDRRRLVKCRVITHDSSQRHLPTESICEIGSGHPAWKEAELLLQADLGIISEVNLTVLIQLANGLDRDWNRVHIHIHFGNLKFSRDCVQEVAAHQLWQLTRTHTMHKVLGHTWHRAPFGIPEETISQNFPISLFIFFVH
jgi:hypothetical protein